jgi:hypothetical protein
MHTMYELHLLSLSVLQSILTCHAHMQDNFCDIDEAINYLHMIQASNESHTAMGDTVSDGPEASTSLSTTQAATTTTTTTTTDTSNCNPEPEEPRKVYTFTYELEESDPKPQDSSDTTAPATTTTHSEPQEFAYDAETEAAILAALTDAEPAATTDTTAKRMVVILLHHHDGCIDVH